MVQETGIKAIPMEKKRQKATWLSGKAFHIAVRRREAKSKGEKKRYNHLNAESQRLARRETKAFFSDPCPDREDNNRTGKTRESLPERQRYQRNVSCQDGAGVEGEHQVACVDGGVQFRHDGNVETGVSVVEVEEM